MAELGKREREESSAEVAVQALEASLGREADIKLKALAALAGLIDANDEAYAVQRDAAEAGVLPTLMQLLEDDSDAVRLAAAGALRGLAAHSAPALDRLDVGRTTGYAATPEKVALNPVQEAVSELDGVFNLLTNLRFADDPELAAAGAAALTALTALNRPNTLAALRELVHRLLQHEAKALEALEGMLAGLDVRDDMAVLLDQALSPTLTFLRSGSAAEKLDAVTLLGSVCEKRPGAAGFLVAEGALPAVAQLLVSGELAAADAAARSLWLLVRDNKKLLSPAKDALGLPGTKLVEPLLALVEAGEDQDSADEDGGAAGGRAEENIDALPLAVDNGDDALLLLRGLAGQDEEVRAKLAGQSEILGTRCAIM